jgi:hypothetical protein
MKHDSFKGLNELIQAIIYRRVISDTRSGIVVYMRYPCLDVIPRRRESRLIVEHQAKISMFNLFLLVRKRMGFGN